MQPEPDEVLSKSESDPPAAEIQLASPVTGFFKPDALVLWVILFVFGGGLLALYYAGIGYFPEVSWQDALTFMALMTIIGGSLLVAYSFLLVVPGAIWSEFLICEQHLRPLLMMGHRRWEPCVWAVTKRILFPFALFMAFCHFLLYEEGPWGLVPLGAVASLLAVTGLLLRNLQKGFAHFRQTAPAASDPPQDPPSLNRHRLFVAATHTPFLGAFIAKAGGFGPDLTLLPGARVFLWVFALLPLVSFAALFLQSRIEIRSLRRTPGHASRDPDHFGLLCRAALAFDSAALLSLMALWFFHRIYERKPGELTGRVPWSLLVLCTLVVIVTNLGVSVLFHNHRRQAFFASFLAALLLLGAGQLLGTNPENTLPAGIMAKFGFGGQAVRLVVTERGGRLLCEQGIAVDFESPGARDGALANPPETAGSSEKAAKGKPRQDGLLARADRLVILSRLGSQVLLRFHPGPPVEQGSEDENGRARERTIVLPREEVVSWSTLGTPELPSFPDGCKPPVAGTPALPDSGSQAGATAGGPG
jgi:hypothetical protein